jgi:hypothetical protein
LPQLIVLALDNEQLPTVPVLLVDERGTDGAQLDVHKRSSDTRPGARAPAGRRLDSSVAKTSAPTAEALACMDEQKYASGYGTPP